jgi:hypothetical protein
MASEVRVLVAMEPNMYGEVLAFHIRRQRPRSEVVLASPQTLRAEAERTRPHLTIANEVPPDLKEEGFWAEVRAEDELVATIEADGYSATIHDVTLQDFLAVVDKAGEELADDEEA